ncbi:MAG TPA: hypothetical protein VGY76_08595 [Solirubrobacteraceae bacterium]|nr:hypothetical protein [Solirubrobacteraceae bacterium]
MENIRERVEDATLLWNAERHEGAFLVALVAVAARARREYPRSVGDREAFERFIESRFGPRVSVEFRGEPRPLERVFYKWMRCELVHDGGLPVDLRFKEDAQPGELSVRAGGAPGYVLLISPGWFDQLVA